MVIETMLTSTNMDTVILAAPFETGHSCFREPSLQQEHSPLSDDFACDIDISYYREIDLPFLPFSFLSNNIHHTIPRSVFRRIFFSTPFHLCETNGVRIECNHVNEHVKIVTILLPFLKYVASSFGR
jgi:hypothetical protein